MREYRKEIVVLELQDDIYRDVYNNSKAMTKLEKAQLSALFSQAKYGDAPFSICEWRRY